MDTVHASTAATEQKIDGQYVAESAAENQGNLPLGIWRLCDPKISLASISSMFLGACAAAAAGPLKWGWLALTVFGILALEAAKNASGEVFDLEADKAVAAEDRSPFSGGKRVIVDGLMTKKQTAVVAALLYLLGIAAGLAIALLHEPRVLVIGLAGVAVAYFYNAPPLRLSYRGLGEFAVAIVYGPLILCGTYLVQRHYLPTAVILLSLPIGILISAFLVINEFPDRRADLAAGKLNLVARIGEYESGWLYAIMIASAFLVLLALPFSGVDSGVWAGMIGLPFGLAAAIRVKKARKTDDVIPAQRWTLLCFVLTALGCGAGLLV